MSYEFLDVDFVIVTALQEELQPLLDLLPEHRRLDKEFNETHTYYEANIESEREDKITYRIILTCMVGMGPTNAAIKAAAIMKWKPKTVLLVGICGGIKGETDLGDVLIGDQIADYTLGKIAEDTSRTIRWRGYPADANLLDSANNLINGWQFLIKTPRPKKGSSPKRKLGTIVSGGDVITCADILTEYKRQWPKLLGVEMEGGGLAAALDANSRRPGLLMIKAVSDHADKFKNSRKTSTWRSYACSAAAAYAIALIRGGPIGKAGVKNQKTTKRSVFSLSTFNANLEDHINQNSKDIIGKLTQIETQIDSLKNIQITSSLKQLLQKAESDNPGLTFEATTTTQGTNFSIKAKPGSIETEIGSICFDLKTHDGRQGLDKFKNAIEQGIEVSLRAAECSFNPAFNVPWPGIESTLNGLKIKPQVPQVRIPIRIIVTHTNHKSMLDFTYLSLARMGTAVTELVISGGHLTGEIRLTVNHEIANLAPILPGTFSLSLDVTKTSLYHALQTVDLLMLLQSGSVFSIELLDSGKLVACNINNSGIDLNHLSKVRRILKNLDSVNKEFNLHLTYPDGEGFSDSEEIFLSRIANAISHGIVEEDYVGIITGRVSKEKALEAYDSFARELQANKSIKLTLSYKDLRYKVLEHWLEMGDVDLICSGLRLMKTREEVIREISSLEDNEQLVLSIENQHSRFSFKKWSTRKSGGFRKKGK